MRLHGASGGSEIPNAAASSSSRSVQQHPQRLGLRDVQIVADQDSHAGAPLHRRLQVGLQVRHAGSLSKGDYDVDLAGPRGMVRHPTIERVANAAGRQR